MLDSSPHYLFSLCFDNDRSPPTAPKHAKSPDFAFIAQLDFKYSINFIHIFNTVPDLSVFVVHLSFNPLNPLLLSLIYRCEIFKESFKDQGHATAGTPII